MSKYTILTLSLGLSPQGSYFVPTTCFLTFHWAPFCAPPCPSANHQKGYSTDGRVHPTCMSISLSFHWSFSMYPFWPTTEMESGGTNFCNGWACHRLSCRQSFNLAQGLCRSIVEEKEEVGVRGPAKTHSKLYFHSLHVARPRRESFGILPQFYP